MSDLVDGVNLPLTDDQVRALVGGQTIRIDIPPDPEMGTTRTTVVIVRPENRRGILGRTRRVVGSIVIAVCMVLLQVLANLTKSVNVTSQWDLPFFVGWGSLMTSAAWFWVLGVRRR